MKLLPKKEPPQEKHSRYVEQGSVGAFYKRQAVSSINMDYLREGIDQQISVVGRLVHMLILCIVQMIKRRHLRKLVTCESCHIPCDHLKSLTLNLVPSNNYEILGLVLGLDLKPGEPATAAGGIYQNDNNF